MTEQKRSSRACINSRTKRPMDITARYWHGLWSGNYAKRRNHCLLPSGSRPVWICKRMTLKNPTLHIDACKCRYTYLNDARSGSFEGKKSLYLDFSRDHLKLNHYHKLESFFWLVGFSLLLGSWTFNFFFGLLFILNPQ